jgi:hypothetical protein
MVHFSEIESLRISLQFLAFSEAYLSGGERASEDPGALPEPLHYPKQNRLLCSLTASDRALYMLGAVAATAQQTRIKIFRIRDAMNSAQELARTKAPKIYSKDLIELIFELPYCKIRFLEQRGIAKRQTAAVYLKTLEDISLLQSLKVGREVYYLNTPLLAILKE